MSWLLRILGRVRSFFRKRALDEDLSIELAAHLEMAIEDNQARGLSYQEARRLALVSLGGMESLATRPAMSSHRGLSAEARRAAGVSDGLIRLSVGVEALDDLLADLDQALRE